MSLLNPIFALVILVVLLFTAKISDLFFKTKIPEVKYPAIDGLRGYLAIFVFIHHSAIWYYYPKSGLWSAPPSNLFSHFGDSSVVLFFMVTGFLFYTKLIEAYNKPFDWLRLYVSRFLRITPLYFLVVMVLLFLVFIVSDFKITESPVLIFKKIIMWLGFGIIDTPDINNVTNTNYITGGVIWTLKYEWLFYFSLQIVSWLAFKIKCNWKTILFSLIGFSFVFYYLKPDGIILLSFAGGIAAALLNRTEKIKNFAISFIGSIIALVCLISTIIFFDSPYDYIPLLLLSIFFIIIANGNSLFGILQLKVSRALGQISYTIYLVHGLLLYITFNFILKNEYSVTIHWMIISLVGVALVLVCRIIYELYEGKLLLLTSRLTNKIRGG